VISDTMMKKAVHYTMMRQTVQWQDCYKRVLVMSARSTVAVLDCTAALSSLASWPVIGKNFTNRRVFAFVGVGLERNSALFGVLASQLKCRYRRTIPTCIMASIWLEFYELA
jgi:hypothetical protein